MLSSRVSKYVDAGEHAAEEEEEEGDDEECLRAKWTSNNYDRRLNKRNWLTKKRRKRRRNNNSWVRTSIATKTVTTWCSQQQIKNSFLFSLALEFPMTSTTIKKIDFNDTSTMTQKNKLWTREREREKNFNFSIQKKVFEIICSVTQRKQTQKIRGNIVTVISSNEIFQIPLFSPSFLCCPKTKWNEKENINHCTKYLIDMKCNFLFANRFIDFHRNWHFCSSLLCAPLFERQHVLFYAKFSLF